MKTYFAYGSNLNEKRLKARISTAKFQSRATLSGHRLVFEKPSTDGSGKATIIPDPKSTVEGVTFTYEDDQHDDLQRYEAGYSEATVTVKADARDVSVSTFVADRRDPTLKPFDWYVHHIVKGGCCFGLPEKYLRTLATVPTVKDTNTKRVAKERAFLE